MNQDKLSSDAVTRVAEVLRSAQSSSAAHDPGELAARLVTAWDAHATALDYSATHAVGAQLAEVGYQPRVLLAAVRALAGDDATAADDFGAALLDGYLEAAQQSARQRTVAEMQATQRREDQLRAVIQELSTPIIPIHRGVLVLPLVGTVDSVRAQEITERLLEEIVRQQADIVILDITGVSVVDTSVANHLIMAAQAVNLLGSRVIFTGISSTIAQTIVQLGITLGDVVTLSNLEAGMQYALEQLGLEIAQLATA